jgi:hypothetical protein
MERRGGKRPNSGRKSKAEEMGLAALLEQSFGLEERRAVIQNLTTIAKGTDFKAAVSASALLLGYTFGKPTEKHEHSGQDGDAIEVVVRHVSEVKPAKDRD